MTEEPDPLVERREVWVALSDLWLDTELEDSRLDEIADVIQNSGFTRGEVRDIYRYELAPFLGRNGFDVAGEWAGFDPDWVCAQAECRMGRPGILERLVVATGIFTWGSSHVWREVERRAFPRAR